MQNAIVENNLIIGILSYKTDNSIEVPDDADLDDVFINGKLIKSEGIIFDDEELKDLSENAILELLKKKKFINFKNNISTQTDSIIKNKLKELDYTNEGEVSLYATNPNSKWNAEAVKVQNWIEEVYTKMYDILDKLDEKNYSDIDLNKTYPKLEV